MIHQSSDNGHVSIIGSQSVQQSSQQPVKAQMTTLRERVEFKTGAAAGPELEQESGVRLRDQAQAEGGETYACSVTARHFNFNSSISHPYR